MEIIVASDGIFAKTIPFKDDKLTKALKNYNLEGDIKAITNSIKSIKKSISYEKVDVFGELDLEKLNIREFN